MLATLLDRGEGVALPLPPELEERYGGPLRFPDRSPFLFANFVSTLDGVVSYDVPGIEGAQQVSASHAADRFVLALLRAVADAVIVGAGTLRKEPKSVWTATSVMPDLAPAFGELRRRLGRPLHPTTVIVTSTGDVDRSLPAFRGEAPVILATTRRGAAYAESLPNASVRLVADAAPFTSRAILDLVLRETGGTRILTEGGPTVLGGFLREGLIDELFLTVAPRLAGRSSEHRRLALVEAAAFEPKTSPRGRLLSLKSADDYLFTRYAIGAPPG